MTSRELKASKIRLNGKRPNLGQLYLKGENNVQPYFSAVDGPGGSGAGVPMGLTHRDLADYKFFDSYSDECDPEEVAIEVLQANDFFPPFGGV